jgi:hypothetical protein
MIWKSESKERLRQEANARRQKAYRARMREVDGPMVEWLKTVVDLHAKRALERLARHYGVTQRAALERMIAETESREIAAMETSRQADYYRDRALRRNDRPEPTAPRIHTQNKAKPEA